MEKIQSAIAKARAARSTKTVSATGQTVTPPVASASQPESDTLLLTKPVQALADWTAIPGFSPNPSQLARNHIVAFERGSEATPIDIMRTKLLQLMRANNWRHLAITSPGTDCGKTMVTLNLAFSLARQSNLRILVAEVDLRRPSMAATLKIKARHSFASVLQGTEPFENHVIRYGQNLVFATNHSPSHNSAELLHGPSVGPVLADIETRYNPDLILFDMPPLLVSDDAMAFVTNADCALVVAAAESTTIKEIDLCERMLAEQTNVLGVVLNKCRYMGRKSDYEYY